MAIELDYYNCEHPEYYEYVGEWESKYLWDPINLEYLLIEDEEELESLDKASL